MSKKSLGIVDAYHLGVVAGIQKTPYKNPFKKNKEKNKHRAYKIGYNEQAVKVKTDG